MSTLKQACNKAQLEIQAINAVRIELAKAKQNGASDIELGPIHARLMNLYASLDALNIESIIHQIDYKKVA